MQTILTLGLAALAAAAPAKRDTPHYPATSLSKGFLLIANVTDPTKDLSPSVNGWVVQTAHIGPPFNAAVLQSPGASAPGRIFYENGTDERVRYGQSTVITDGATPPSPFGILVQSPTEFDTLYPTEHDVFINGGPGTPASITRFPSPYAILQNNLGVGTFVACNNTIPYYGYKFITINYAYATFEGPDGGYQYNANIPEGCAPITLLPQCTTLNELPPDAYASHEFAVTERCYEDVAGIDWSRYGP
ncbi:hypothetical protein B0H63DRAFT_468265 [Podospora didyma]|uniref:DUF7907 domain-containing protein n=1 Tax=Podospora didyma TaxID=330526 RepID=A0AAE0NS63_9PEZI|nr:hypothetical protein B0H63DRAFT_468265 [Podospora didyma]